MQQSAPSEPPLVDEGQRPGGQQHSQEDEGVGTPVVNNNNKESRLNFQLRC